MDYFEEIKDEISRLKESGKLVMVEGKKDVNALHNLGLKNVAELKGPLFENVESIEAKEVVVLMDTDKEGKKLYSRLKKQFDRRGVKVDNKLRHLLFKAKISHVEGLDTYIKNGNLKRN